MEYLGLNVWKISNYWVRATLGTIKYYLKYAVPLRAEMAVTKKLRNSKSDRVALVLATGPSLKKLDAKKIAALKNSNVDIIGVNHYLITEFGQIATPTYSVLSDPAHWDHFLPEEEVKHFTTEEKTKRQETFKHDCEIFWDASQKTQTPVFAPAQHYGRTKVDHKFLFCDSVSIFRKNFLDITKPLGYISMTAYKALSIACCMGYKQFYICGFDNSFFKAIEVDENNEIWLSYGHSEKGAGRYKAVGGWLGGNNVGEILYGLHFSFTHIEKFKKMPIVNLDPLGLITAFPKKHELDVYVDG